MYSRIVFIVGIILAFASSVHAGDPGWLRRDPAKAAAQADVVVVAKIRDVFILSGKTGRPRKTIPEWVDERVRGERLRLTLERPQVLWPVGGSIPNEIAVSWDGVTTSFVTAYKNSTVILLLAKTKTEATIYTPPEWWPIADITDLQAIQNVLSTLKAPSKPE